MSSKNFSPTPAASEPLCEPASVAGQTAGGAQRRVSGSFFKGSDDWTGWWWIPPAVLFCVLTYCSIALEIA